MALRVVGAGLPRTGTESLRVALEQLLGGRTYHMSVIPGHPFDLGEDWQQALANGTTDWEKVFTGFSAAVDWPASLFWRELSAAYPDALVLLSLRDSAETWVQSVNATILPVAHMALAPDWQEGQALSALFERFTGSKQWDDPVRLRAAYEQHNQAVRESIPAHRLLEWRATDGWQPICQALGVAVPEQPFPWTNRRENWG